MQFSDPLHESEPVFFCGDSGINCGGMIAKTGIHEDEAEAFQ